MTAGWSVPKAAGIGAVVGGLYQLCLLLTADQYHGLSIPYAAGLLLGAIFGGAFLFAIAAVIRNCLRGEK